MSFTTRINNINIKFQYVIQGTNYDEQLRQLMHDRSIYDGNLGKVLGFIGRYILPNNLVLEIYNFILTGVEGRLSWFLMNGDEVMGLLTLKKIEEHEQIQLEEGKKYYRVDLSLIKKYQRQGIATYLTGALDPQISLMDIDYVIFDVPCKNVAAQRTVQKMNVQKICTVKDIIKFDVYMLSCKNQ